MEQSTTVCGHVFTRKPQPMSFASNPMEGADPTMAAAAIVPGPAWTLTFVLRSHGVHAGHWLLPRGGIVPGESAEQAARREAAREVGIDVGAFAPTGIYEISGHDDGEPYWMRLYAYRSLMPGAVPSGTATRPAEVDEISQAHPRDILPYPTDMRVLNDAGLADYDAVLVQRLLDADGVTMVRLDAAPTP